MQQRFACFQHCTSLTHGLANLKEIKFFLGPILNLKPQDKHQPQRPNKRLPQTEPNLMPINDILHFYETTTCHISFKTGVDLHHHWTLVVKNNPERNICPFLVELQSKQVVSRKTSSQTDPRAPQIQNKVFFYNLQFQAVFSFHDKTTMMNGRTRNLLFYIELNRIHSLVRKYAPYTVESICST